jgi:hypothetical protein
MVTDELHTVSAVVDALGGTGAVAVLTRSKWTSAVSNWRRDNAFPPKTYATIKAALKARGLDAPDALWKMESAL